MVEWKKLGEVCSVYDGTHQTPQYTESGVKFVSVENIDNLYNTNKFISEKDYSENYKIKPQKGDVLMTRIGDVGRCAQLYKEEPIAYYVSLALLRPKKEYVLSSFIKHIIESKTGRIELRKRTLLTAVPLKINLGEIGKIKIPIPSLDEQKRIVGILDTFTDSIENLKEQIAQRRKHFEFYRDQLLDLEGKPGVEMLKLREACEIRKGIRVVKKQLKENAQYPVFQNSIAPMGYYDQFNRNGNMPYIICAGSSSGSVGYCCTPFWAADDCFTIESSKVNIRYTYYALKKNNNNLFRLVRKGSMPRLPHEAIDNMVIPIPSLVEQQRIVSILDTFEASISNLEAQLEQRQKQYEYYRNQLLTFE